MRAAAAAAAAGMHAGVVLASKAGEQGGGRLRMGLKCAVARRSGPRASGKDEASADVLSAAGRPPQGTRAALRCGRAKESPAIISNTGLPSRSAASNDAHTALGLNFTL